MKKSSRTLLYSILLSTVLSVAAARQAGAVAIQPKSCYDVFVSGLGSTATVLENAERIKNLPARKRDEFDEMKLEQLEKVLALPDGELRELVAPATSRPGEGVAEFIREGKSLDQALDSVYYSDDELRREMTDAFDEQGHVRLEHLPQMSLSLENGRQKLDFARIHFSRRDWELSEEVLKDYLAIAENYRGLKLLVVTDRAQADLDRILKNSTADVRKRIRVVRTTEELWIWAQDGSKPIDLAGETAEFTSSRYSPVTTDLDLQAQLRAHRIDLPKFLGQTFQGGDIIVGDRHVFVGEAEIKMLAMVYRVPDAEILKMIGHIFQKTALPAYLKLSKYGGEEWSFHIDMDMVLAVDRHTNKEVALIRSPEALLNALSDHVLSSRPTNVEVLWVRDHILKRYARGDFGDALSTGSREFIETLASWDAHELRETIAKGRLFKRTIESYGYQTRAMPTFGEAQAKGRSFFYGTNAVLTDGLAIVPNNKMPELDRLVRSIYEDLGYDVIQARSAADTICQQGGIRCVTETYRKPYLTRFPERVKP